MSGALLDRRARPSAYCALNFETLFFNPSNTIAKLMTDLRTTADGALPRPHAVCYRFTSERSRRHHAARS